MNAGDVGRPVFFLFNLKRASLQLDENSSLPMIDVIHFLKITR